MAEDHESEKTAIKKEHTAECEGLKSEHATQQEATRTDYESKLATLEATKNQEFQAMKQGLDSKIEELLE